MPYLVEPPYGGPPCPKNYRNPEVHMVLRNCANFGLAASSKSGDPLTQSFGAPLLMIRTSLKKALRAFFLLGNAADLLRAFGPHLRCPPKRRAFGPQLQQQRASGPPSTKGADAAKRLKRAPSGPFSPR